MENKEWICEPAMSEKYLSDTTRSQGNKTLATGIKACALWNLHKTSTLQKTRTQAKQLQTMRVSLCPNTTDKKKKKTPQLHKEKNTPPRGLICCLHNKNTQNMQLVSQLSLSLSLSLFFLSSSLPETFLLRLQIEKQQTKRQQKLRQTQNGFVSLQ